MDYKFEDYKIQIVNSSNYPDKFVATIEEFYNVICIIDNKEEAPEKLRSLFDKEIVRLKDSGQPIPKSGSGKAKITFAANDKIEELRPFIDEFWKKILGTSYSTSFVSNDSYFDSWLHYVNGDKDELISKVKQIYSVDISSIYDRPICEILTIIKSKKPRNYFAFKIVATVLIILIPIIWFLLYKNKQQTIAEFATCKENELCLGGEAIILKNNNTFEFYYGGCLSSGHFKGTWLANSDTLTLNGRDSIVVLDEIKFVLGKDSTLSAIDTTKRHNYSWVYFKRKKITTANI